MYSRIRVTGFRNFSPWKSSITNLPLAPRPRKNRPSDMTSMFNAVMAKFAGDLANTGTMLVPIRIREVTAANCASDVNASSPQASPIVMQLYPNSSANTAVSRICCQDIPGVLKPMSPTSPILNTP